MNKGEASRNRLIAAAEELFAQHGAKATTVSSIVAKAGLTQAAFYLYFKSKDEMLEQLLDKFSGMIDQYVNAGKEAAQQPKSKLEDYVARSFIGLFQVLGHNPNLTRIAFQETRAEGQLRERIVQTISDNMKRNQRYGIVEQSLDAEVAAESVVASVERLIYRYVVTGERTSDELGRQAARLFLNGILSDKDMMNNKELTRND